MASPAKITQTLPDTLPADFGDWDGADPPVGALAESTKLESRDLNAGQAAARDGVAADFASRNPQADRTLSVVPRIAVAVPAHPRAFAAAVPRVPRPASSSPYAEGDALFRRIRSLTTVVDKLPEMPEPMQETARTSVVTASEPDEIAIRGPEDSHFRAMFSESTDVEEEKLDRKRKAIIAVAAGSLLLVVFQLIHSGTVSKLTHMVARQPVATSVKMALEKSAAPSDAGALQNDQSAPAEPGTKQATLAKPTAGTYGALSPAAKQTPATPAPEQAQMMHDQLLAPTRIPESARRVPASDAAPAAGVAGIEALNGNAPMGAIFKGQTHPNLTVVTPKVTVSAGVAVGMLIRQSPPSYPPIAKSAHVSGTVVIQATISKTGSVENLRVVSGPAMLRQSALEAVKTWRYRPYKLNNEPTDVETTVNVIFSLGA